MQNEKQLNNNNNKSLNMSNLKTIIETFGGNFSNDWFG